VREDRFERPEIGVNIGENGETGLHANELLSHDSLSENTRSAHGCSSLLQQGVRLSEWTSRSVVYPKDSHA